MAADPIPTTYFWFPQDPGRDICIVARTVGDPAALAGLISAAVRGIDPDQPVAEVRTMQDFVSADLARSRFTLLLLGGFAAVALLLVAIGLYGVIAFWVAERTQEIGIRVSLGAEPRHVLGLVMRHGLLLTAGGLAIGIAAALALGRAVAALLYGVTPNDPPTLLAGAFFLTAVSLLASYLPARRALRLDPLRALRAE
jgi:ABC-type antimicrobial peptide transport system permease subunit